MDRTDTFPLDMFETALSCHSMVLDKQGNRELIIVGTAYVVPEQEVPKEGRLLVFDVSADMKMILLAERKTSGAVFSIADICMDNLFAAGVGSKVSHML